MAKKKSIELWLTTTSRCIVQNSEADWHRECGMMERVYQNCVLDIAAAHARDGKCGCYSQRNPHLVEDIVLKIKFDNGSERRPFRSCRFENHLERLGVINNAPLHKRGWVFQEILLSTRTAHFGKDILHWECASLIASEISPQELSHQPKLYKPIFIARPTYLTPKILSPTQKLWSNVVYQYSRSELSYSKDKRIAFAGVAKAMQRLITLDFGVQSPIHLAGLWSHPKAPLEFQLLWTVNNNPRSRWVTKNRSTSCVALSWSWASVEDWVYIEGTFVDYRGMDHAPVAEVLDFYVTRLTKDPLLQVVNGTMTLRSWMLKTTPTFDLWSRECFHPDELKYKARELVQRLNPYLVPICYYDNTDHTLSKVFSIICLVILPTGTVVTHRGVYHRIGILSLEKKKEETPSGLSLKGELSFVLNHFWKVDGKIAPPSYSEKNYKDCTPYGDETSRLLSCKFTTTLV
jgi:hypothetical protein